MVDHSLFRFSITIHSTDLAVVGCLRALAQFSQNSRVASGSTKDKDWRRDGNTVTFHFTSPANRDGFKAEAERLLRKSFWTLVGEKDDDPAVPQR